jgi:predicted ATPase/DNA-binding SARP family transcriptional activator
MEYRVLGPLEVVDAEGHRVALGGARQQTVLASLLLRAGRTVSLERLVEDLWEEPPATAGRTVQAYVSRLRRELPDGAIESVPGGYSLSLDGDGFDLHAFEQAADEGKTALAAGEYERAAQLFGKALARWRGPALAGLVSEALRREADRLEELRLQVLEDRFEADLARGRHRELVPELQALVAEHPFRERPRAQLMLALYRSGRPSDALELYRKTRLLLVEELGMEPGEALRKLEQAILRADPALDLPRSGAQSNLPAPPTPLIGRERELREVLELLQTSRLLTLTGPGGIGKTRLALQTAAEVVDNFRDGVWLIELAALRDPELVLAQVAEALGLKEPQTLGRHLGQKHVLLVLDNFEQLLPEASSLALILRQAPSLKLLVTSRARLHLSGEQVYPVPPLTDEEAARLFVERARAVEPSFEPDRQVGEICRRLDNLPLAIELAAARATLLSPKELLARIGERLPLLSGGPLDAPERQRTLRATIEWSYELLSPDEQQLFARLAVFAGGCTLNAAEEVAEADVDALQSLVDKSLLRHIGDRFLMLETIREFGLELLDEANDAQDLRRRHARFFVELLGSRVIADPHDVFATDRSFRERVAPDVDNVRTAVEWALAADEIELAVKLVFAGNVVPLSAQETAAWYDRALERAASVAPATAADGYRDAAFNNLLIEKFAEAQRLSERSIALYRKLGDPAGEGHVLRLLGTISGLEDRPEDARRCFEDALAIAEEHRLDDLRASVLHGLGEFERDVGHPAEAAELLMQSIELARAAGNLGLTAAALHGLGDLLLDEGDLDAADARYLEALAIAREVMFEFLTIGCFAGLAGTAAKRGEVERAGKLWGAALASDNEQELFLRGRERVRYERALAAVAGPRFEAAVTKGKASDLDAVVERLLSNRV